MTTDTLPPAGYRPLDLATMTAPATDVRLLDPGSGPNALLRLRDALPQLPTLAESSAQLTEPELTEAARVVAALMQRAEATLALLTADAIERGAVQRSTASSPAHWVRRVAAGDGPADLITAEAMKQTGPLIAPDDIFTPDPAEGGRVEGHVAHGAADGTSDGTSDDGPSCRPLRTPGIEPAHAARIANVAAASLHASHRVMTAALREGHTSVGIAHAVLHHLKRVSTAIPTATTDEIHAWFLALPAAFGSSMVNELTRRIIAEHGSPSDLDDREQAQQRVEFLRYRDDNDGMTSIEGLLSGDHAAEFKHIIDALSAPAPKTSCCDDPYHRHAAPAGGSDGEFAQQRARLVRLADDERTPGKRRIDALMMLLRRVARWLDGDPTVATTGPAQMVVTVDYDTLAGKVRDHGGGGGGTNREGTTLSPATVRRMACDANIVPMVLGTASEPLDVGRTRRLYTGGLRLAVLQKYGGRCTFQDCNRPGDWTEIHHAVHWANGGRTDLANGYPLCGSDHDTVHRDNLVPVVTAGGRIRWVPAPRRDAAEP